MYKNKAIVDIAHLMELMAGLIKQGYSQMLMKEAYNEETDSYVLVIHPVTKDVYESFKPDVDNIDLN